MNKEFIPYEQALELKELGFDEPCFAHLIGFGNGTLENGRYVINHQHVFYPNDRITSADKAEELGLHPFVICGVPLYQQAFRWFREKHNLRSFVDTRVYNVDSPNQWIYDYQIKMGNGINTQPFYSGDFDSYEEAELECLIKLIEIAKGGNK